MIRTIDTDDGRQARVGWSMVGLGRSDLKCRPRRKTRLGLSGPPVSVRGLVVGLTALAVGDAVRLVCACDTTVRDAAYEDPRDVHRLCVMGKSGDPSTRHLGEELVNWLGSAGSGLNLELIHVSVDDPNARWTDYGIPSAPPSWPVVVLAGRRTLDRTSFFIDHWEPGPTDAELERLRTSPARERIRQEVGRRLALLLYVRGTDPTAGAAEKVLESTVNAWGKKEPAGLEIVRVDRADQRERLLLSFIGAPPSGPDWVAVVFGRGKLMPPLQGPEITESRLDELLQALVGECTCLRSPASMGVDLLMLWDEALDRRVVKLRTLDDPQTSRSADRVVGRVENGGTGDRLLRRTLRTLGAVSLLVGVITAVVLVRRLWVRS